MLQGTCSKRVPIKYTFFNQQQTGFLDMRTNIIYSDPLHTDCAMADYIPIIWNGTFALYQKNGSVIPLSKARTLQWTPFSDANLQLTVTASTFQQLEIYNLSDFNDIAMEDFVSAAVSQTRVLQTLDLTENTDKAKAKFAIAIWTFSLFSLQYGIAPSFFQIWLIIVCLWVSAHIAFNIVYYCCIQPHKKQCRTWYQQFAILVKEKADHTWRQGNRCQHHSDDSNSQEEITQQLH